MYKEKDNTPAFEKFYLPFGGHLKGDNRWVRLSEIIPWDELECKYSKLFSKHIGRNAKPVRVALGSILINEKLNLTDEETVQMIRENHYLQFFIGFESYKDEKPFDPSMMVHFRRRLGPDIMKEINETIAKNFQEKKEEKSENDKSGPPPNQGQLIIDATCFPQDIRFPNDVAILDEARRKTEEIIDALFLATGTDKKPRTYK